MMKRISNIILIRPPLNKLDNNAISDVSVFFPPNGLFLLASVLKRCDYNVTVQDMYENSWFDIQRFFQDKQFDVVGITCFTGQHLNSLKLAKLAKENIDPSPLVVLGGPHPSAKGIDEQILSHYPQIDYIVRGEGEETLIELFDGINQGVDLMTVKGITFRLNKRIVRTSDRAVIKNLDLLPLPDYSNFDFSKVESKCDDMVSITDDNKQARFLPIISSRGCPNKCQFCAIFMGRQVRFRSPENVVDEIEQLYRMKKVVHFTFVDDCFNTSLARAEKICQLIIERKFPITWTAMVRVKPISENFFQLAKDSGCLMLAFGVESGSKKILETIGKNINLDDFIYAIEMAKKIGIKVAALFMVGNPGETKETIDETISLIKKTRPKRVVVSPTLIFPNSELYYLAIKQGILDEEYWLNNSKLPYYTAEHSLDELRYFRFRIIFYHCLFEKKVSMVIKLGILILGYRFVKLFNLQISQVRDFLLKIPIASSILKSLKSDYIE
ncbi:MAG: B12-binding domain-containing radical SAM protein [Candidatus Omnitrophica bacterium]|nr:B12-binding domain-containing radical SAM protein [Candidatus Omnitrophota bacterium]